MAVTERQYLSGRGPEDTVRWDFEISSGRRAGEAATIAVPSQWELQGFGRYSYGLEEDKPGEIGRYATRFTVPRSWRQRHVRLVFAGVMTDALVELNGERLGPPHQGGFTEFSYDVGRLLRWEGENELRVEVIEESRDASVRRAERDADYWVFGGIFRPVYLEAVPRPGVLDVAIDASAGGDLSVAVEIADAESASAAWWRLLEWPGERPVTAWSPAAVSGDGRLRIRRRIAGVRAWSAERPVLYLLELQLRAADGRRAAHRTRFGFRTVRVDPQVGLLVNGRRVRLRGINRHSFWPTAGRSLSAAQNRRDVELLREMNLNAVRTSHYPPDRAFLDACDELGLYVVDELPGWHDAYDERVGVVLVEEMVRRDRNHPSILLWANGNEGGWNEGLDRVFRRHDPQARTVLHPDAVFAGFDTEHYPSWRELQSRLDPRSLHSRWSRLWSGPPSLVMPTEALHALFDGGGGAALGDYWRAIREAATGAGIFLWTFVDEAVARSDRGGELDSFGNFAPDGVVGPFREREGSFYALREIFAPVAVIGDRWEQERVAVTLENRFDELELEDCRIRWRWLLLPEPGRDGAPTIVAAGEAEGPAAPPGSSATLVIERPPRTDLLLEIEAWSPRGELVATWSMEPPQRVVASESPTRLPGGPPGKGIIRLRSGQLIAEIDPGSGELLRLSRGEREVPLRGGPRRIGRAKGGRAAGVVLGGDATASLFFASDQALQQLRWRALGGERLEASWSYVIERPTPFDGVEIGLPEAFAEAVVWRGLGPFRVWRNRPEGVRLGLWRKARNGTSTGQQWTYPEFKGLHAGVRWMRLEGDGADLVLRPGRDLAISLFPPPFAEGLAVDGESMARHTAVTGLPQGLGILHGLPAIGTKFHRPDELGPASSGVLTPGVYEGSVILQVVPRPVR